jgi:hypothetical protein
MKQLSNAKNLTIPWYLLYLIDKNHEKRIISTVPMIRVGKFIINLKDKSNFPLLPSVVLCAPL